MKKLLFLACGLISFNAHSSCIVHTEIPNQWFYYKVVADAKVNYIINVFNESDDPITYVIERRFYTSEGFGKDSAHWINDGQYVIKLNPGERRNINQQETVKIWPRYQFVEHKSIIFGNGCNREEKEATSSVRQRSTHA